MGKVIPFSGLPDYLARLRRTSSQSIQATILDTNVLITSAYEVREEHGEVARMLDTLVSNEYRLLATVNTKAEFLEFQRRLLLTENLLDAVDEHSKLKVPKAARAKILSLKGTLSSTVASDPERDFVFNEPQLKKIKQEFSAGDHSGQNGWLELCDLFLAGRIQAAETELMGRGIEYVSQHEPSQKEIFDAKIDWPDAILLSEKTGASFSDSMILNAFRCSRCPFIVSQDFDVGYAVLADPKMKDAVMPDRLAAEYRHYHFEKQG